MAHVPASPTADVTILSFSDALRSYSSSPYAESDWLYIPPFYSEYRYILGTRGNNPLVTIGINPSTAEPGNLDNTLKSVQRIALSNGFDSFIMFNVYAQRATDPDHMEKVLNRSLHRENTEAFDYILSTLPEVHIWAAWGAIIEKRDYLAECVADLAKTAARYNAHWYTCGRRSKAGHPHHPLYLKKTEILTPFDPEEYLTRKEAFPNRR